MLAVLKKVRLTILAARRTLAGSLHEGSVSEPTCEEAERRTEICTEGNYLDNGKSVTVTYRESEQSDLAGSQITLSFSKQAPGAVTVRRGGNVRTTLEFEAGLCFHGVYQTPVMPFEVCVQTERVENTVAENGRLLLDYVVELKGAEPERVQMQITVVDAERSKT